MTHDLCNNNLMVHDWHLLPEREKSLPKEFLRWSMNLGYIDGKSKARRYKYNSIIISYIWIMNWGVQAQPSECEEVLADQS